MGSGWRSNGSIGKGRANTGISRPGLHGILPTVAANSPSSKARNVSVVTLPSVPTASDLRTSSPLNTPSNVV